VDDPAQPVAGDRILGKVLKSAPLLGYLLDVLRRPGGLAILIYVPAFMTMRSELKRLRRQFGRQSYSRRRFTPVPAPVGL
jgi:hypothetical protein